jgi:hypothetical protein
MLWVCGGIALVGLLLTVVFLPRRAPTGQAAPRQPELGHDVLTVA